MRKFLVFNDGERYELPLLTYDEFILCNQLYKEGSSDLEYSRYLRDHNYHDLSEFHLEDDEKDCDLIPGFEYWVEIQEEDSV